VRKNVPKTHSAGRSSKPPDRPRLYELEVALISGPITRAFARRIPHVIRTIQIRGDQTLEDLHHAIFKAFDRFDEHMYEFQVGGKGPMDPKGRRYVLAMAMADSWSEPHPAGDVARTTIGSLGLKKGGVFGYWFDFGDDWWHQVDVVEIHEKVPPGRYPKITARTGASPPQYPEEDEETEDDDDDDEDDDEE